MHEIDEVSFDRCSWGLRNDDFYEKACDKCERTANVNAENIRQAILIDGGLFYDKRKGAQAGRGR
eukprot:7194403-Pyramimonas_sp.AAC.1